MKKVYQQNCCFSSNKPTAYKTMTVEKEYAFGCFGSSYLSVFP